MSFWSTAFQNSQLSKPTSIFGLKLWIVIGIFIGSSFVLLLFLLSLCRRRHLSPSLPSSSSPKPRKPLKLLLLLHSSPPPSKPLPLPLPLPLPPPPKPISCRPPEVSHLGWGHCYTLRELELATDNFCDDNVIGQGGYGIVYRGVLQGQGQGHSVVAVKNLLNNNNGQAEKEFQVEVETIGRIRHKNLVRLLGYCVEAAHRMLVYEYVDNGNLDQWLRGALGEASPLSWEARMNVILGTAKGLAYLHEGLEPKVVHRDVKSSNILLDKQWNPKVSDFGLAKLLGSERTYVTTRVMGTFGYVAPEYASTGMLNERSDVYSFGVLIMEIISGRAPVDYTRPPGEVNLVDWLKRMVGDRKSELVVDHKMRERPSPKALKRMILVALRCVDPDAQKRPKMGHVIHMLEVEDLFREERKVERESAINSSERYNPSKEASFSFGMVNLQPGWR